MGRRANHAVVRGLHAENLTPCSRERLLELVLDFGYPDTLRSPPPPPSVAVRAIPPEGKLNTHLPWSASLSDLHGSVWEPPLTGPVGSTL